MPEPADFLKSLKSFKGILESSEVNYRDATVDERNAVIREIITDIREAAEEKGENVANDSTLWKASGFVALHLQALSYTPWLIANCKLVYEPPVGSQGGGNSTDQDVEEVDQPPRCRPFVPQ